MGEALVSVTEFAPVPGGATGVVQPKPGQEVSFRDVLSAVNPLQYLPVVGTIYRAVTGDTIPEPLRNMGSLLASGLMGGPVGIITNLASLLLQKVTGIDTEAIGTSV